MYIIHASFAQPCEIQAGWRHCWPNRGRAAKIETDWVGESKQQQLTHLHRARKSRRELIYNCSNQLAAALLVGRLLLLAFLINKFKTPPASTRKYKQQTIIYQQILGFLRINKHFPFLVLGKLYWRISQIMYVNQFWLSVRHENETKIKVLNLCAKARSDSYKW